MDHRAQVAFTLTFCGSHYENQALLATFVLQTKILLRRL